MGTMEKEKEEDTKKQTMNLLMSSLEPGQRKSKKSKEEKEK